jgi:hypothetical protein
MAPFLGMFEAADAFFALPFVVIVFVVTMI